MQGKVVLITGASSGIGLATARELAKRGTEIIMVVRDAERGEAARRAVISAAGHERASVLLSDFTELASVRRVAQEVRERWPRLDVLCNNAGAIFGTRRLTCDGFESTFQVNHLAHFLLTNLLVPTLIASAPSRVITVSSRAHVNARRGLPFGDLMLEHGWSPFTAYANSKLANVLFAYELARRLGGTGVTSNAMHPGLVATGFGMQDTKVIRRFYELTRRVQRTAEEGADTIIYLASSPDVAGVSGKYFYKRRPVASSRACDDVEAARRLWDESARMTGVDSNAAD